MTLGDTPMPHATNLDGVMPPVPVQPVADGVNPLLDVRSAEWAAMNGRRVDLLYKRSDEELTTAEVLELGRLQAIAEALVDAMTPRMAFTPEQQQLLARLDP